MRRENVPPSPSHHAFSLFFSLYLSFSTFISHTQTLYLFLPLPLSLSFFLFLYLFPSLDLFTFYISSTTPFSNLTLSFSFFLSLFLFVFYLFLKSLFLNQCFTHSNSFLLFTLFPCLFLSLNIFSLSPSFSSSLSLSLLSIF